MKEERKRGGVRDEGREEERGVLEMKEERKRGGVRDEGREEEMAC